jgi:hypothetical protein
MTIFVHVLVNLQLGHDRLLHGDDDEFDNQCMIRDFDEYYLLLIQSKSDKKFIKSKNEYFILYHG